MLSTFFPPLPSEPRCPLCFCLPLTFPCFALGHVVFFHYCFLNSKNIDGRSELCFPGGGLGFLCPFELLGAQQFPSQVRSGQPGLILESGFVESDRAPALSKLTAASLWCEMRVGFTWRIFGGGGALSSFICLSKPFQNTCNSGIGEGGIVILGDMLVIQGFSWWFSKQH